MEPEWAAVELLECVDSELNLSGSAEQQQQLSSQTTLSAIRVLPAPVAGDLFVTCAARGHVGAILFYFEEGLPIDHSHTTLKYQALHAAVEFGHLDAARLLVCMGAKVDARGGADDRSPLFLAALAKRWDACAWLLERGASKIIRDKKGLTAYQAMAGSSDPEVAGRSGMLTDPPQRIVSVACRGITHRSLDLTWSEPLRSYDEEVFVGYRVEWRPMRSRPVYPAHSRHVAERVRPPRKAKKKRGREGWQGAEARPATAGEAPTTSHAILSPAEGGKGEGGGEKGKSTPGAAAELLRRPNTGGGETTVDADGCRAEVLPWKIREVESNTLTLKHLHPATNYMVRVSARTLAGYGVPSREALLRTRVAPPSAPPQAVNMVSATPNSITVGWVPPKYENGEPITRYEIQRLVLDQHHPDWDKGRESVITGETLTTTTTSTTGSCETNSDTSTDNPTTATTTTPTTTTGTGSLSATKTPGEGGGQGEPHASNKAVGGSGTHAPEDPGSAAVAQEAEVGLPSVLEGQSGSGSGHGMGDDRKQVGVWVGQRTDKMTPYHTAGALPTYCRALFRVRAENMAGWGPWSPSSDALEAQDIILPVKRGATQMLMRWFNKPEGDVLRWELSRRVFRYGTDFRGDDDDSWLICSRDIPGLSGGESTFRCKGLMPGTEYQFRLRAYSNGSWQAKEESIVSSPFKTICSPPDPPACPRTRQLASDPLVVGGLPDTGALLSAKTAEISCRGRRSGGGGGGDEDTSSGIGRRTSGAAATAAAAAIGRGKAQAEAEWENGGGVPGLGGSFKGGHGGGGGGDDDDDDEDDSDDDEKGHNDHSADVSRSGVGDTCKDSDCCGDEGNVGAAANDEDNCKRRNSSDDRRGGQREQHCRESCDDEQEEEEKQEEPQKARMGRKCTRRTRSSGHDARAAGQPPLLLPALTANSDGGRGRAQGDERKESDDEEEDGPAAVAGRSDSNGSTTMVLDWDPGCTNGAITTNYEVWGLAEAIKGETTGSGEWKLVAVTEAAPTATLSGLRAAQPYQFKVRARNGLGWSCFGPPTAPLVLNPLRPCAPPELMDRGVTWMALKCTAPPRAGLVLGFEIHMCRWAPGMSEGEESWELLAGSEAERGEVGSSPSSSTTAASIREERRMVWDLKPGAGYRFKARARTVFGWSPGGPASDVYNTTRRF
eukprot:g4738.t1